MVFQDNINMQNKVKKVKTKDKDLGVELAVVSQELNGLSRRSRVLEERYTNLRRKIQVTDRNMLNNHKKLQTEIDGINEDLREVKLEFQELRTKMKQMVKEIRNAASKEDVNIMKHYLEFWQPLNFVTHEEIDSIIEEKLRKLMKK